MIRLAIVTAAAVSCLFADASYSETVQCEGGSLVEMMRGMANGPMGKMMSQAFQDQTLSVYIKGKRWLALVLKPAPSPIWMPGP